MAKTRQAETLFVIAEQTGQIAERSFEVQQFAAVDLVERGIRLQNTISCLAELNLLKGFVSSGKYSSYGTGADVIRERATAKIPELVRSAEEEFKHATGHYTMIAAGEPEGQAKQITSRAYSDFLLAYSRSKDYKAAQAYRRKLAKDVDSLQSYQWPEVITDTASEDQGGEVQQLASDTPETETTSQEIDQQDIDQQSKLSNFEKLEVLRTDPRAGFLPTTNREKTTALTWLSYIDSPDGVAQQLLEVFNGSQKYDGIGRLEALRAVESIVYETADYAADAINSHQQLRELQAALQGILNPHLKLDVVDEVADLVGNRALLRYIQIDQFYQQRPEQVPYYLNDPLRTFQDRTTRTGPGKHKTIHDRLSYAGLSDAGTALIQAEVVGMQQQVAVAQARMLIAAALTNEDARARFFISRLQDVSSLKKTGRQFNDIVSKAIELSGYGRE